MSDQRLLPVLNYAAGHVRKKGRMGERKKKKKMVKKREAETRQIEVRDRNQPGKRDKHDLSGHILHPRSGTLKYSKTAGLQEAPGSAVPYAGKWSCGKGSDQQCMTITLTETCCHYLLQLILWLQNCVYL